jgi:hypothetical protein
MKTTAEGTILQRRLNNSFYSLILVFRNIISLDIIKGIIFSFDPALNITLDAL